MHFLRELKREQNLWPRIAFILSTGFLILTAVVYLLGYRALSASQSNILEQRLTIAQLAADQLDDLLEGASHELEQATLIADFNPSKQDLEIEARALELIYTRLGATSTGVGFLDLQGNVILTYPPERVISDINISAWPGTAQSWSQQKVLISSPYQESPQGPPVAAVLIPVENGNQVISLLVALIDLNNPVIENALTEASILGKTAHAVLVDDQGRSIISTFDLPFLSPGEHISFYQRAISTGKPVVEEVPFELDIPGEPLGHHHIMAFVPLKTTSWGVSIGGDVGSETFAGVWRTFIGLGIFSLLAVTIIWASTMYTTRKLLTPVGDTIRKYDFSQKIVNIDDWEELIDFAVQLPSKIAPVSATHLTLINPDTNEVELTSKWSSNGNIPGKLPSPTQNLEVCDTCSRSSDFGIRSLVPCSSTGKNLTSDWFNSFCLPLVHQDSLVGILHFGLQDGASLMKNQVEILTGLAPDIAMAIESFQFHRSTLNQADITRLERQRISRYLHDTLGQNVSYLRLRLDQLGDEINMHELANIQQDLKRMGRIANQAYEQIRVPLLALQSDTQTDLIAALRSRCKTVAERANLTFDLTAEGDPVELPQQIKRRVLFICAEALNNIEQHAAAHNISIHIVWGGQELTIKIQDDGRGFDTIRRPQNGHFGLDIMHERTQMVGGKLLIASELGVGTTVTLRLPI